MTQPYPFTHTADTKHAKASAATRLRSSPLIVTDCDSESTLAIMHSPRSADSDCRDETARWVSAGGSRLGGPRQCLRVDILTDVRHFAISNGNGEDPMVLERPIRGFEDRKSTRLNSSHMSIS